MDNEVFRDTYRAINERFCPYEKAILTNNCACCRAEKFCIAEREGVHCASDEAQERCIEALNLLRQQARFSLKATKDNSALPHAKAMRVQVGGLRGIHVALHPEVPPPARIADIYGLLVQAVERFGALGALPFQVVIQQIAAYQGRPPSRRRPS
jgi:hypothetical protein